MHSENKNMIEGGSNPIFSEQKQQDAMTQDTFINRGTVVSTVQGRGSHMKPFDRSSSKVLDQMSGTTKKSLPFVECNFTEAATPDVITNQSTIRNSKPNVKKLDLNKVKPATATGQSKRYMMDTITSRTKNAGKEASQSQYVDQSSESQSKISQRPSKIKKAKQQAAPKDTSVEQRMPRPITSGPNTSN